MSSTLPVKEPEITYEQLAHLYRLNIATCILFIIVCSYIIYASTACESCGAPLTYSSMGINIVTALLCAMVILFFIMALQEKMGSTHIRGPYRDVTPRPEMIEMV